MASTPDPSAASSSASPQNNASLTAGLAAFQQKDYAAAIPLLEAAVQTQPARAQAQQRLVVAYEKTGQPHQAITLCRTLTHSPNPQIKAWASKTLTDLIKRYPPKMGQKAQSPEATSKPRDPSLTETGFVPFNPDSSSPPPTPGVEITHVTASPSPEAQDLPQDLETLDFFGDFTLDIGEMVTPAAIDAPKPPPSKTSSPAATLPTPPPPVPEPYQLTWRQGGRINGERRLPPIHLIGFRIEQAITLMALFWFTREVLKFSCLTINELLVKLPFVGPVQWFYQDPTPFLLVLFLGLFLGSPWLMDGFFKLFYQQQSLTPVKLIQCSKEANQVLRTVCQKNGWSVPSLKILPTTIPLALSYGFWPKFARIVVSQGLLEQLAEDEIATIYARELGYLHHGDFAAMSLATLLLQIPYTIYWQCSDWTERVSSLAKKRLPSYIPSFVEAAVPFFLSALRGLSVIIAAISYGYYWLGRWPVLWLSRQRVYYSDRLACELTGNPNGLSRALIKIAMGMAADIQTQAQTNVLLESFDLLTPISYQQALGIGSLASQGPLEPLLTWDYSNPYRQWLLINNTHPLIGERLKRLCRIAETWNLEPEFNFAAPPPIKGQLSKLLVLGGPYFGIPIGLVMAGLFWLMGAGLSATGLWQIGWLFGDVSILRGCLPIGFSLGMIIRINYFYPDLKPSKLLTHPSLADLLSDPAAVPLDSQPIRLQGQLLGRRGISNWFGQDLILQTDEGLVKLQSLSQFGPIGDLWPQSTRPSDLIGKSVTVTGWWRRGATPWIDIETLRLKAGRTSRSGHPVWSTILACAAALWGAYIIFRGG